MVRKVGKYGVNSGNTFRVGSTRYQRRYGADSCIMRTSLLRMGDFRGKFKTGLGENDLKCDGVFFSLNKRGRWFLPELIKQEIINGDHASDDFGIQLIERHKIAKTANCISICMTKNPNHGSQKIKTKRHGYLHSSSVLKHRPRYSRRERRDRRRRGLPTHIEDEEEEPSQVRYDVLYPSPAHCSLRHNPKYIKYDTSDPHGWDHYQTRRRGNRHRKRLSKQLLRDAMSVMEGEVDDSEEETSHSDTNEAFTNRAPVTLDSILKHTNVISKLFGIPTKSRTKSENTKCSTTLTDTKGHVFYVNKDDKPQDSKTSAENAVNGVSTKSAQPTIMEQVFVVLPFEQITPNALRERFGPFYLECECFPRKFILDISDQISTMDKYSCYKRNVRTVNACLVFTMDQDNVMNTLKDSVCKVALNTNFSEKVESAKIETIFDYMHTNLDEVIERTLFFVETLPDYAIRQNELKTCYKQHKNNLSNTEEFARWSTTSYKVDDEFLFKYFTSSLERCDEVTEMGFEVVTYFESVINGRNRSTSTEDENFCGVCYDLIGEETPATALISCGHWFCDRCWQAHLEMKISSGAVTLPCPEYDCDKSVDAGTTLSFVCMPRIIKHAKYRHDTEVERLAETRWCPNETCGRVLHVNSTNVRLVKCQCGEECCFDCLGKPHWPADCESVRKFHQMISARGDSGIVPVEAAVGVIVNGKNCPHCKKFVEKNGGCPYMACVCGKSFCWGCGRGYDVGNVHSNCYRVGYNDKHGTTERNIDPEDKLAKLKRRRWYKMALVHRVGQHPVKYQKMKTAVKGLSKKIKELLSRSALKGVHISLDFNVEGKAYLREADKTNDFLDSMIELYREISRLVENVAVVLDAEHVVKNTVDSSLQYMATRLAMFVNIIFDLFVNASERDAKETIDRMKQARSHARNVIRALVNKVTREQL